MRFVDFLKATVLLSAGGATLLAVITILGAARDTGEPTLTYVGVGWWLVAALMGGWLGRRNEASPPIARLLADARMQTTLPELRPAATLLNRLWALLASTLVAGVLAFILPQVSSVATGFAIVWALAWRRQHAAVAAVEERDAVRFYVERGSALEPLRLIRTPGFGGSFFRPG